MEKEENFKFVKEDDKYHNELRNLILESFEIKRTIENISQNDDLSEEEIEDWMNEYKQKQT